MQQQVRKGTVMNQNIKADAGKPMLTLVPRQIIFDIARVREYGLQKYGKSESWKQVEVERYRDATFRHFMAYLDNPQGVDEESGLPHLSHLACNIAFLCELETEKRKAKCKEDSFLQHLREDYNFRTRTNTELQSLTGLYDGYDASEIIKFCEDIKNRDKSTL
jgi:hypothetical protein